MMVLSQVKQAVFIVPQFIGALRFLVKSFPEFIENGGVLIETNFQYKSLNHNVNKNYSFRTTIQPDGDVISFLPPPDCFVKNANMQNLYEEKYQIHRKKIQNLLTDLGGVKTFSWVVSVQLSSLIPLMSFKKTSMIIESEMRWFVLFLVWIGIAYLFKKFVSKYYFKIVYFVITKIVSQVVIR